MAGKRTIALILGALAAGLAVAQPSASQDLLIYRPDNRPADPARSGLTDFQMRTLVTSDGERIRAWWRPPRGAAGVVLYLHGRGDNLSAVAPRLKDAAGLGVGILAIDYRGYGGSTGKPSEAGLSRDAQAAWRFVATEAPGRPTVIWGESLGTSVAVTLASEVDEAGVVLDSPLASVPSVAHARAAWFPARWIKARFATVDRIAAIGSPLLIVHCDADRTIPISQGRAVFAAARTPKQFITLPGCAHTEIWHDEGKAAILAFLKARLAP